MIWFCPNRSTLQQASGVYRLFRSWGGEVLYAGHEDDGNIAHILSGIGLPCIVKCAVPFSQAEQYHVNFSERFIAQFISDAIAYPEPSARFDLHTKRDLDPTGVMDIIGFTDPRFPELTGYADGMRGIGSIRSCNEGYALPSSRLFPTGACGRGQS